MSRPLPPDDRRHDDRREREQELLAERALFGLDPAELRELAALRVGDGLIHDAGEIDEVELAAAAADLGLHEWMSDQPPLPAHLRDRIMQSTRAAAPPLAGLARDAARPSVATTSRRENLAWLAALAASVAAAWFATRPAPADEGPTPASLRAELLAQRNQPASDVVQLDWTRGADETAAAASGDVIWSPSRQQGVMRFVGLKPNDPNETQYQLWVFDATRDEKFPVDGGVFDIPAGQEEVLVPIRTRLPIKEIKLFAVTVEPPGGVVVSDRKRLPLLAPVAPAEK